MLQSMGSQRVGCDLATEQQQQQEQADPVALVMTASPFREHDIV